MKKLCNRRVIAKSSTVSPALPKPPGYLDTKGRCAFLPLGLLLPLSVLCQTLAS